MDWKYRFSAGSLAAIASLSVFLTSSARLASVSEDPSYGELGTRSPIAWTSSKRAALSVGILEY